MLRVVTQSIKFHGIQGICLIVTAYFLWVDILVEWSSVWSNLTKVHLYVKVTSPCECFVLIDKLGTHTFQKSDRNPLHLQSLLERNFSVLYGVGIWKDNRMPWVQLFYNRKHVISCLNEMIPACGDGNHSSARTQVHCLWTNEYQVILNNKKLSS